MYPHLIQFETRRLALARDLQLREELRAARAAGRCGTERRLDAPKRYRPRPTGAPRTAGQTS
jgi:hypothetical protein